MNDQVKNGIKIILALAVAAGLGLAGDKWLGGDFLQQVCKDVPKAESAAK